MLSSDRNEREEELVIRVRSFIIFNPTKGGYTHIAVVGRVVVRQTVAVQCTRLH